MGNLIIPILLGLPVLLYSGLILTTFGGWLVALRKSRGRFTGSSLVSVLVPCRNEEDHIRELGKCLGNQEYPHDRYEVIWIDDHSTDGTLTILKSLVQLNKNHRLIELPEAETGKKAALRAGMRGAVGELILLTDADSQPGPRWMATLSGYFEKSGNDLILGPVQLGPAEGWFDQLQKLEFMSLAATAAGTAGIGSPILAQGPNLAVRADDYRIFANRLNDRFASGDDVFLLQSMKMEPGKKIGFLLNPDAIVQSKPARYPSQFFRQRARWASKAAGYRDALLIITTLTVFFCNLSLLCSWAGAFAGWLPLPLPFLLHGIKIATDLPLLRCASRFFRFRGWVLWFIPMALIYPLYAVLTGCYSQLGPVNWKEKKGN